MPDRCTPPHLVRQARGTVGFGLTIRSGWFTALQDPDGVWYVPLRVPAIDPSDATVAVPPVAASVTPAPRPTPLNEKPGKLTVWSEIVPETVTVLAPPKSCTWTAAPV